MLKLDTALNNALDTLERLYETEPNTLPADDQWVYIFLSGNSPQYVGITKDPRQRMGNHRTQKWSLCVRSDEILLRPVSNRQCAEAIEARLIRWFDELENKAHPELQDCDIEARRVLVEVAAAVASDGFSTSLVQAGWHSWRRR